MQLRMELARLVQQMSEAEQPEAVLGVNREGESRMPKTSSVFLPISSYVMVLKVIHFILIVVSVGFSFRLYCLT